MSLSHPYLSKSLDEVAKLAALTEIDGYQLRTMLAGGRGRTEAELPWVASGVDTVRAVGFKSQRRSHTRQKANPQGQKRLGEALFQQLKCDKQLTLFIALPSSAGVTS